MNLSRLVTYLRNEPELVINEGLNGRNLCFHRKYFALLHNFEF